MPEKVFITGATGFIGFAVLRHVLESGYTARALVRRQEGADLLNSKLSKYSASLETVVASGSIEDESTFDGLLDGTSYVIHVASPMPQPSEDFQRDVINPAVNGTQSILKAASKVAGIKRVVITSSFFALFDFGGPFPERLDETSWANYKAGDTYTDFLVAYSASKSLAEKAVWQYVEDVKPTFDVITLLPSFVFGRNDLAEKGGNPGISNGIVLSLLSQGAQASNYASAYVNVEDVAFAHVKALDTQVPGNNRFLLTSGEGKWNDAIEAAKSTYPDHEWNFGSFDNNYLPFDNSKAEKILGIKFRTFAESVKDMLKTYFGN